MFEDVDELLFEYGWVEVKGRNIGGWEGFYDSGFEFYLVIGGVEGDIGDEGFCVLVAEVCFYYVSRLGYFITARDKVFAFKFRMPIECDWVIIRCY